MIFMISSNFSLVSASNLRVRFGLVFEALTAAQVLSVNFTRTPSMVMQSYLAVKWSTRSLTMANFLLSGVGALNSGVVKVFGRSSNS